VHQRTKGWGARACQLWLWVVFQMIRHFGSLTTQFESSSYHHFSFRFNYSRHLELSSSFYPISLLRSSFSLVIYFSNFHLLSWNFLRSFFVLELNMVYVMNVKILGEFMKIFSIPWPLDTHPICSRGWYYLSPKPIISGVLWILQGCSFPMHPKYIENIKRGSSNQWTI